MQITRRINNNAVICLDSRGRQVVALGKGVGFNNGSQELPLELVERTFYDVNERYLALIDEVPLELLAFSARIVDEALNELPYELSTSAALTLADHISFMLERTRRGMHVTVPLALEIRQCYPLEWRIGAKTCQLIEREFAVELDDSEAAGIAINLVNSSLGAGAAELRDSSSDIEQSTFEQALALIEKMLEFQIDRDSFNFARFSSHLAYLLRRVAGNKPLETDGTSLYQSLRAQMPKVAACVDAVADLIERSYSTKLSDGERLYLMMHVNRVESASLEHVPEGR